MEQTINGEKKKKILIISIWESIWSLGEGAGVSDDYYFFKTARGRGFDLHVVAPAGSIQGPPHGGKTNGTAAGGTHTVSSYPNFFRATRRLPTWMRRLLWPLLFQVVALPRAVAAAVRWKPDFILGHSHYTPLSTYAAGKLTRTPFGVKLFGVMELVHMEWGRRRYVFKNFEQILALKIPQDAWIILNDGTRGKEAAMKLGVPEERIRFLPNGVNMEWAGLGLDRAALRGSICMNAGSSAGSPAGDCIVLFLARLVPSKRPEDLIRAIPRILERTRAKPLFLFVGDGPSRTACERIARELGVAHAVRFEGAVLHERVPEFLYSSDIFVSTSNLTNMAIPTCEAFLCGVPAVVYDVGDTASFVKHDRTGLVVPDGDIPALADAVASLIDDPDGRRKMGENAKAFALEHCTGWDERTSLEIDLIESLIDAGRA
ncbi:MAG: glycosyltransferase family 4 protein [Chitinivibrionia bacterium]|nr:glycosyltransferase family 4 protein [Chitinivibrionia bacterium]